MELLSARRKRQLAIRHLFGLKPRGDIRINDISGIKGTKYLAKNESLVEGTDYFSFKQFANSPHVRYCKGALTLQ
jgi:hypothetical protein